MSLALLQDSARKYVSALLSPTQAKSGDKLPVIDTVKETDATTIKLTPTGKNIFVRLLCPCPFPRSSTSLPTLGLMYCVYACDGGDDAQTLTDDFVRLFHEFSHLCMK